MHDGDSLRPTTEGTTLVHREFHMNTRRTTTTLSSVLVVLFVASGIVRADTIFADADDTVVAGSNDTIVYGNGGVNSDPALPAVSDDAAADSEYIKFLEMQAQMRTDAASALARLTTNLDELQEDQVQQQDLAARREALTRGSMAVTGSLGVPAGGGWSSSSW